MAARRAGAHREAGERRAVGAAAEHGEHVRPLRRRGAARAAQARGAADGTASGTTSGTVGRAAGGRLLAAAGGEDLGPVGAAAGGAAVGEVAGEDGAPGERGRQLAGQARIVDVRIAVHPDRVEEGGHVLGAAQRLPFGGGHARGVEHLAQAQHGGGAAGAEGGEHGAQLAVDAEGVAVGDEQIGLERREGGVDGGAAQVPQRGPVQAEAAGPVLPGRAGHAGQHQPVPALRERVAAGVGVAGDQQPAHAPSGQRRQLRGQREGEGAVAPGMPQTHGVVGVQRDRGVHRALLLVR